MNKLNDDWLDQKVNFPPDQGEIIDWLGRSFIEFQFSAIKQNLGFLKISMKQEMEHLEDRVSKFVDEMGIDDDEIASSTYHALLQDGYSPLHNKYPLAINAFEQIQWRSNFLVLYSLFEYVLNEICYVIEKKSNLSLTLKDIHGAGIERARNYLVKVARVEMPFQSKHWQRAKLLSDIRNKIVHGNGEIDEKFTEKLKEDINKNIIKLNVFSELNVTEQKKKEILLSYEFVKQSVDDLQKVVIDICNYQLYAGKS